MLVSLQPSTRCDHSETLNDRLRSHQLKDCPVSDGDTLIVVLVPTDSDFEDSDEKCF